MQEAIFVGGGGPDRRQPQALALKYANRHGLIAGATGTGKTVTLQVLAEGFSAAGVAVFMADVKGDLSGIAAAGSTGARAHPAFARRAEEIGQPLDYQGYPVTFWDIWGREGLPIRATVAEMGPLLLARMLGLNETQEGVLSVAFRLADEEALPVLDLKDLRALLVFVADHAEEVSRRYGLVAGASVAAIQRALLQLEDQGAAALFGEPALDLADLLRPAPSGAGMIHVLAAARLMLQPGLYATFLLWLLSELFETLPEVGDLPKPRLVFFFDEAHLLFKDAPKVLVAKVEQVARLIRSKGVGVYFISQSPSDIPPAILGQLGNRVQHGLRAFTPRDQKDLVQAAQTYRPNPRFDTAEAIRELATGEAVTSFLQEGGVPGMVERTLIRPPHSQLGPLPPEVRATWRAGADLEAKYRQTIDRDSAYERLQARAAGLQGAGLAQAQGHSAEPQPPAPGPWAATAEAPASRRYNSARAISGPSGQARRIGGEEDRPPSRRSDSLTEAFAKSFARQLGRRSGNALARGVLGGLLGGFFGKS